MLTNDQLIDSLIVDCNEVVKNCFSGEYVAFCNNIVQMVTKLANLQQAVRNDMKNRDENIAMLEKRLADFGHPVEKIFADELLKGEPKNGCD